LRSTTQNAHYSIGVRGNTNRMTLKPRTNARDIIAKLERTFKRSAQIDADKSKSRSTTAASPRHFRFPAPSMLKT